MLKISILKSKPLSLLIRASAFQCLGNAWPTNYATQTKHANKFLHLLINNIPKNVWNVRVEILSGLKLFLQKTPVHSEDSSIPPLLNETLVKELLTVLFDTLGDAKYSVIRTNSLDVIGELISATEGTDLLQPHLQELNKQLSAAGSTDSTLEDRSEKIKGQLVDHLSKKRKS